MRPVNFRILCSEEWKILTDYQSFIYSPTDALENALKNSIKIYIKTYIKTALTCFGVSTPSSGSAIIRAY